MFVSVICPTFNEERYISKCIESIINQDIGIDALEFLIIDGRSTDRTRKIVTEYIEKYPFIRLLDNPHRVVPYALNTAIDNCKGQYIVRIDGHCTYPRNYISRLTSLAESLDADNIGALWRTLPANHSLKAHCIASALSHKFGVGSAAYRIGCTELRKVDTVPFGCFRRDLFSRIGVFDTDLIRNQDDEFNGRIIKNGGSIYLVPDLVIDYYARDSFTKLFKMFYQYGLFKPLVNKKLGTPTTLRQFAPLLFVLGLIFGAFVCWIHPVLSSIYAAVILVYLCLSLFFSLTNASSPKGVLLLMWSFFVMHFSYGLGYLMGIYKIVFRKKFTVESNH